MKKLSLLILFVCLAFVGLGQLTAASYGFTATAGTYSSISATGTSVPSIYADDNTATSIPIGFNFTYCGTVYTTVSASSDGWLSLANCSSSAYPTYINATSSFSSMCSGVGMLMPFWDDLYGAVSGSAYCKTTGTSPNRVFTFEWNAWPALAESGLGYFEVKLYETTNVIEFVYGNGTYTGGTATIGIANSSTDYQTLPDVSSSPTPSSSVFYSTIASSPANGQVYRWTPPGPCSGTPTAGTAVSSVGSACPATSFNLSLTGTSIATGLTYQWESSATGVAWTTIAGATNATYSTTEAANTYYHCIVTCTASSSSSTSSSVYVPYLSVCYCTAPVWYSTVTYGDDPTLDAMSSFTLTGYSGSSISDAGIDAASIGTGYVDRTGMYAACNLQTGGTYSGSVTFNASQDYWENQIWIDFNDNGTFESSETVTPVFGFSSTTYSTSATYTMTIPAGAATGVHRMRVRNAWLEIASYFGSISNPMDPCAMCDASVCYWSGDVADYLVNIQPPCPFSVSASNSGPVCPGAPFTLTGVTTAASYSWSGPSSYSSTSLSPTVPGIATSGTYTLTATDGTCTTTATTTVSLLTAPVTPTVTPATASICNGSSVMLTSSVSPTPINLIPVESWESGVPTTAGVPVDGWSYDFETTGASGDWTQVSSGSFPTASAEDGTFFADFGSFLLTSGTEATLYSPSFSMVGFTGGHVTFWVYRDCSAYNTAAYNAEGIRVYINTSASLTGTTPLGFVPRRGGRAITGPLTGTSTTTTSGWYQYTATIPAAFTGATNYILFKGHSAFGDDTYLDNISITGIPTYAPATWSPTTYLFTDAGFTIPYTAGTTTNTVYVHPTTVSTTSTVTYTASITNGTCSSTDSSVVTITSVPAITGTTTLCVGTSSTLSDPTPLGTWSTSNTTVATVNPSTGVVTGAIAGIDTVYYTVSGCSTFVVVTVNTAASPITGTTTLCSGGSFATLTETTSGGVWTSTNTAVATVTTPGLTSTWTAHNSGTATISYTLPGGCYATLGVIVDSTPTASISGTTSFCSGGSTNVTFTGTANATVSYQINGGSTLTVLLDATGNATVGTGTLTTGGTATTYTYTLLSVSLLSGGGSCVQTLSGSAVITVNPMPGPIGGTTVVCEGSTILMTDMYTAGTWTSSPTSTATVGSSSGVVTGVIGGAGPATITYTMPGGCNVTLPITVLALPSPITGAAPVCVDANLTLSTASGTGTWSSVHTGIATVDPSTGMVTGVSAGTDSIVFTSSISSCITATIVTVNPLPAAIAGPAAVCSLATITLTDDTLSGTWSVTPAATASIVSGTGVLTGGTAGAATVTYTKTATGCYVTYPVTVNALPSPIVGVSAVCSLATVTLTDATTPANWSSSNSTIASVGNTTGIVTGGTAGSATISFTIASTGCYVTHAMTVNALPAAISGVSAVCSLATITLTDASTPGTWSASGSATVGSGTGVVTGGAAGSATITFTNTATSCYITTPITVNALPSPIAGVSAVCSLATVTLTDATTPANWSSSNSSIASIGNTTGIVTGGTAGSATISFTIASTGCYVTAPMTVNALPSAIGGPTSLCNTGISSSITLTDPPGTGTWSTTGTYASVGSSTGVVTGLNAGSGLQTITYTLPVTGCYTTTTITVNPAPAAIGGTPVVCVGSVTTLTEATPGGTWSPLTGGTATVASATSGVVSGLSAGTQNISYTLSTGCAAGVAVTVNALPAAIVGPNQVCQAASVTFTDGSIPGVWSVPSGSTIASVGPASGLVTGGTSTGTETVTFTSASTGCYVTKPITVNLTPQPITGVTFSLCDGGNLAELYDATPTGTWSTTASSSVATIGSTSGIITSGTAAGSIVVSYTMPVTGCAVTTPFTINPLPSLIGGAPVMCQGATQTLSCFPSPGTWSLAPVSPAVASINAAGVITGLLGGTTTVTYTLSTGCYSTLGILVNQQPSIITGVPTVCAGGVNTTTLYDSTVGGTWSSAPTSIATVNSTTGVVTGGAAGTAIVTYTTSTTGCTETISVTVVPLTPPGISMTLSTPDTICAGTSTTFTATATNAGTAPLYVWSINGVITAGGTVFTYMPVDGDVVKCWVLSNYTCAVPDTASTSIIMHVNAVFAPSVAISTGMGDTVCFGSPVTFTAIPSGGGTAPTYHWWKNFVSAGTGSTYGPLTISNGDIITCSMTSNYACRTADSSTQTVVMTVSLPKTPTVNMSTSSSHGATSCEGEMVTYTAAPTWGGYTPAYQWYVNGLPIAGATNSTYAYLPASGDAVKVQMTSDYPCLAVPTAVDSIIMSVLPIEFAVSTVTAHPGFIVPATLADTFVCTILSGGGLAPTFQWFKNGIPVSGATNTVWIAPAGSMNTGDSIACQVENTDPCSGISSFQWIHIVIGDNVGVTQVAQASGFLNVVPNPTAGAFVIKGSLGISGDEKITIELTDMLGQMVHHSELVATNGLIDERVILNNTLASGMYLLNVRSEHMNKTFHVVLSK